MAPTRSRLVLAIALVAASPLAPAAASANPMPLPFTYVYDTLPRGEAEVEQYVDLTPVKAETQDGHSITYLASQLQTEYEVGLTDHLELGLYLTVAPQPPADITDPATLTEGTGLKQRLRLRLLEPGVLPVDVGLYGEVVENDREIELEAKIILERRMGALRVAANLWAEREYELATQTFDWVLDPTAGASVQLSPMVHLGVEGWMRGEWPDARPPRTFALGPHELVGPTVMLDFGRLWWSTGIYARVDDLGRAPVATPSDDYGPLWVRSIVGVAL